jgi:hypothetical protein
MVEWSLPEERKRLTKKQWTELWIAQDGRCGRCNQRLVVKGANEVEIWDEHLQPLSMGGLNDLANRQLWCKKCSATKTAGEAPVRAKSNRVRARHIGVPKKRKSRPIPGSRDSGWKAKIGGGWERR